MGITDLIAALASLATAALGVWLVYLQRAKSATPEQRRDDNAADFALLQHQIAEAEERGDFAAADALRRLVREHVLAPEREPGAGGGDGEQLPPLTPRRDDAHAPE